MVAALIVCPEMSMPSKWLPGSGARSQRFRQYRRGRDGVGAVMVIHRIDLELAEAPEDYAPVPGGKPQRRRYTVGTMIGGFDEWPCGCARMQGRPIR